jgi:site-specific DNA-methyltransferase (adenine-specific)
MPNHRHYGDNLTVLRESIAAESVDLVTLDPPFNSNASYNVLFKASDGASSAAQIEAFDDTWLWNDTAKPVVPYVVRSETGATTPAPTKPGQFLKQGASCH